MPAHVQREDPYRRISPPPANNPVSRARAATLIELAERDADAELVDALHDALDVATPASSNGSEW